MYVTGSKPNRREASPGKEPGTADGGHARDHEAALNPGSFPGPQARASDAWDLFRLLKTHNAAGEIATAIAHGPPGLAPIAAAALDRIFRTDVTRIRRWIHGYGEPGWTRLMTDDALADLATEVIEGLTF
jgi:hypothetical protein